MSLQPLTPASLPAIDRSNPPSNPVAEVKAVGSPNGSQNHSRLPQALKRSKNARLLLLLAVGLLIASGGIGVWYVTANQRTARNDLVTHKVKYEKLQLTIVERGQLESAENRDVLCRVKARSQGSTVASSIKWVIDDGSQVRRGQLLVELDDSGLQELLKTKRIEVDKANSDWVQAEENYKIVASQNLSDIKKAETDIELAKLDLEKYLGSVKVEVVVPVCLPNPAVVFPANLPWAALPLAHDRKGGEFSQLRNEILGRHLIAESDLEQHKDRMAWSDRMARKGYVSQSQSLADQNRHKAGEVNLAKVREELRVLQEYTFVRNKKDLENKLAEAERALDRVKTQANSKLVQAETDRRAKKSIYEQEISRRDEIEEEIRKCTIIAPQDGMVVYFVPEQSRSFSGSQQSIVAQGEPVREGQKLMRLPDLRKMVVMAKVHEAMVSRVKGEAFEMTGFSDALRAAILVDPHALSRMVSGYAFTEFKDEFKDQDHRQLFGGQPAEVRIDAFPDKLLKGHVKSVATVASQADWMSSDVKVYQTVVALDDQIDGARPGMSAEVRILAGDTREPVLTVPIQAILGTPTMGTNRKLYVLKPDGTAEMRDVVVGMSNDKMAEIRDGLQEGDDVILNPKVLLTPGSNLKQATPRGKGGEDSEKSSEEGQKGGEGKKGGRRGEGKGRGPNGEGGGPGGPPGTGNGGPGGPPGMGSGGAGGPPGGGDAASDARRQFMEKMKKATPDERKQMLQAVPEEYREKARQSFKAAGLEVAN